MDIATVNGILDARMREISRKAEEAKSRGDDAERYKLNTAWRWLDIVRQDIADSGYAVNTGEVGYVHGYGGNQSE